MSATATVVRCRCGHGPGYHNGTDGQGPPDGECFHVDCPCETWAAAITEPGVYQLDADTYHADPVAGGSLSSSGARRLLPPSCPARFRYERENPPPPRPHFDIGHAAHRLVLGDGPDLVVIDAPDWRTKAAKEARAAAHEAGQVPLLKADYDQVQAMADAIRAHPVASKLFTPGTGRPEQALIWRDDPTGIMRRALLDWLPNTVSPTGRLIIPDYKTARSADPDTLAKAVHTYGYHQQAAWYGAGVQALGLADDWAFLFVCQEKDPPYLVTIVELDHVALRIGDLLNRRALNTYATCVESGRWPGYADDRVALLSLPPWAEAQEGAS